MDSLDLAAAYLHINFTRLSTIFVLWSVTGIASFTAYPSIFQYLDIILLVNTREQLVMHRDLLLQSLA